LNAAAGFDSAARRLISYCLSSAAEGADASKEWAKLSRDAKLEVPEVFVVRFVESAKAIETPTADEIQKERLEGLLSDLQAFSNAAGMFERHLKDRLNYVSKPSRKLTKKKER
jgi:uncharacterized protein YuzB (UPF0349 family)